MLKNQNTLAYSKELDVIGSVGEVSFLNQTVTIVDADKELHKVPMSDVELLEQIGLFNGAVIYNRDVLGSIDGKMYEIVLQASGQDVQMHLLNNKLERVEAGEVFAINQLDSLSNYLDLIGNIHELEVEDTVDFNVTIVKDFDGKHITYFYACNNKENQEVDLIKVLYFGSTLLKEEEYERRTLSYEVYLDSIEQGTLKEVTPRELNLFVTGAKSFENDTPVAKPYTQVAPDEFAGDFDYADEEDRCTECSEEVEDCVCYEADYADYEKEDDVEKPW